MELVIREYQSDDDLKKLTDLIHAAYALHAASGLKYWGTHQSVKDTQKRIAMGICLIALIDGEYEFWQYFLLLEVLWVRLSF